MAALFDRPVSFDHFFEQATQDIVSVGVRIAIGAALPNFLSLFFGMPQPQNEHMIILNLIANFILPNNYSPHLTAFELEQLLADARIGEQD